MLIFPIGLQIANAYIIKDLVRVKYKYFNSIRIFKWFRVAKYKSPASINFTYNVSQVIVECKFPVKNYSQIFNSVNSTTVYVSYI